MRIQAMKRVDHENITENLEEKIKSLEEKTNDLHKGLLLSHFFDFFTNAYNAFK